MSFSFLIGLGAALGLLQVYRHTPPKESTRWIDASLLVMFLGLLGSRLVFVLLHLSYYREHVFETLQFWQGGLSVYGALAGGLLAAGILPLVWKKPYLQVCDRLVPLIPPLAIFAWLGCMQVGVAYGNLAPANAVWGMPLLDESGVLQNRVPLQIAAALVLLVYYALLEIRPPIYLLTGIKAIAYFAGLAVVLIASSLLRADASMQLAGLRIDTWAGLGLIILVILAAIYACLPRAQA